MTPFTGQIIAVVTLTASTLAQEPAAFHKRKLSLGGAAQVLSDRLRLTPATRQLSGAAWLAEKQNIANGFEVLFQFQLTRQGGRGPGADGFAFVLQTAGPDAIAGRGSAGGFAFGDGIGNPRSPGIPRSIAVFFDTYKNGAADPSDNYVAIFTNGPIPTMRWPPNRLAVGRKLKLRLKDGRVHEAGILYN